MSYLLTYLFTDHLPTYVLIAYYYLSTIYQSYLFINLLSIHFHTYL
jgi:hypothetical protein